MDRVETLVDTRRGLDRLHSSSDTVHIASKIDETHTGNRDEEDAHPETGVLPPRGVGVVGIIVVDLSALAPEEDAHCRCRREN